MLLKKILTKSISGDQNYKNLLYDRFAGMVMGISMRYASNQDQAMDIFQETFLKVFSNLRKVKDADAIPGWIKQIAINTCLNSLKSQSRYTSELEIECEGTLESATSNVLDDIDAEKIIAVINSLPNGYRIIINMAVIDGYSHQEIAKKLNISESTSRSQLTHAKRQLRLKLSKIGIIKYEAVI